MSASTGSDFYSAIGGAIGHEISHGFDDSGRQYDGEGNLRDWWTAQDAARFRAKADALVAEYSALTVLDGQHVNGQLTLGENIGDLSGLSVAYHAKPRVRERAMVAIDSGGLDRLLELLA